MWSMRRSCCCSTSFGPDSAGFIAKRSRPGNPQSAFLFVQENIAVHLSCYKIKIAMQLSYCGRRKYLLDYWECCYIKFISHWQCFKSTQPFSLKLTPSCRSSPRCSGHPGAVLPIWLTTRWHGYSPYCCDMERILPTRRALFSLPINRAICPYVATFPNGISSTTERTS